MPLLRRHFLQALATFSVMGLGRPAQAAAAGRIPFGFSLYGMKSLPVRDALTLCADIGYSGVELPVMADWPCDPERLDRAARRELRRQLTDLVLEVPALMENLPLLGSTSNRRTNLERLRRACDLAHDLAGDSLPVIETILGGKPADWARDRAAMAETLGEWGRIATDAGVTIAIKAHVGNALHLPEDVVWLLKQVRNPFIKAAYDFSHFERQGLDLAETIHQLLPDVVFVHVKDNVEVAGRTEFALPGDGETDYVQLLRLLRAGNYAGAVVVEVSSQVSGKPGYDPAAAARRSYQQLQPAFRAAGLRANA